MSDRLKRYLGMLLAVISIAACAAAALPSAYEYSERYRSVYGQDLIPEKIPENRGGSVSVNAAGKEELTELYGVGETIAEMILAERQKNGPYYYPEDLEAVRGIGPATLLKFRSMIDLSLDESGE